MVTLDENPGTVLKDRQWEVGFTVLQHGRTPVGGLRPTVTLIHRESREIVEFEASEEGALGHYTVSLSLPDSGTWDWSIAAFSGDHPQSPLEVKISDEAVEDDSGANSHIGQKSWFWAAIGTGSAAVTILVARLGIVFAPWSRNRQVR